MGAILKSIEVVADKEGTTVLSRPKEISQSRS
jgi:hypothetical protein